jgi:hypothetical protein
MGDSYCGVVVGLKRSTQTVLRQLGGLVLRSAFSKRAEIYDTVRDCKLSGFVTISGVRHSFWAGYAAPKLPPAGFDPIGQSAKRSCRQAGRSQTLARFSSVPAYLQSVVRWVPSLPATGGSLRLWR